MSFDERYRALDQAFEKSALKVFTLGYFEVVEGDRKLTPKEWGRDKTVQLFQYLITTHTRKSLHKEQIIDGLWDFSPNAEKDFKVALHGIHKVLEPNRPPRTDPKYISRNGQSYQLNKELIWIDTQTFEAFIALGNEFSITAPEQAIQAYRAALELQKGTYLPNRNYEDWSSEERERLQVLTLGALLSLAELELEKQPMETIRLTQQAIGLDATWEDAYQWQMKAYLAKGNRPAAIKAYQQCVKVLDKEFGLDPLPETQEIYDSIF